MRACPVVLLLALLGPGALAVAAPAPSEGTPATAPHAVVLTDGRTLPARTKPMMAFGQVSFVDAAGAPVRLDVRLVDVTATRARSGAVRASARTWTGHDLANVRGRIQVVGVDTGPESDAEREPDHAALLRTRMEEVEERISALGPDHAATPRLMKVQLELQAEISRLLRARDVPAVR